MVGSLLLFLALSGPAQENGKSPELTLKPMEVPATPKPLLACEGTTDLPDGARLEVTLYYEGYYAGLSMGIAPVIVEDGKYAYTFRRFATKDTTFPDRNMAGEYLFRVVFEPGLQKSRALAALPRKEVRKTFRIGTAADGRRDRTTVRQRLIDQARAVADISKEVLATAQAHPEEFMTDKWDERIEEWHHRGMEIFRVANSVPEYRALKIQTLSGELEPMLKFNKQLAYFAERKNVGALRQGRAAVAQAVQDFKRRLSYRPLTHEEAIEIAAAAREALRSSAEQTGDALGASRRKFIESVMTLGSAAPTQPHGPRVQKLVESTRPYFEARSNGDSEAGQLRADLESQLAELIQILKKETPKPEEDQ